jgi:ADP-heptose:LPS heptosyltransferase
MIPGRGNGRMRLLDRYVGVPLVFVLGAVRRRRRMPANPRKFGLLNTAAIGDTVLMSAVVADLRGRYKESKITLLTGPSNYQAACLVDGADSVKRLAVFNPLAALLEISKYRFDVLLDFGPWSRLNALLTICSRSSFTVGFRTDGEHRHFGYDIAVAHGDDVHELENHRRLVKVLGILPSHMPSLRYETSGMRGRIPVQQPFVVVHMWPGGSGAELKEWVAERWLQVVKELTRGGYRIILTGAREQWALNESFIESMGPAQRSFAENVAGISLAETTYILSQALLVISVNTGVMHLAAAVGVPLVALHGPTNVKRWGPVSDRAISVESPLKGCGYLNLGFELPRRCPPKCMEAIAVGKVLAACRLAIERYMPGGRSLEFRDGTMKACEVCAPSHTRSNRRAET